MLYGADISYAQGKGTDWRSVSLDFVYARASFGTIVANDDDNFVFNHDGAKERGIPFGAYHYWTSRGDPLAQAQLFLKQSDGYQGQLRPMVDVEDPLAHNQSIQENIQSLSILTSALEQSFKCRPVIYTSPFFWNAVFGGSDAFSGHPLWVAHWGVKQPMVPTGWAGWLIWQYGSSDRLPGFKGVVDTDVALTDSICSFSRPL